MQAGEYIIDRWIVSAIRRISNARDIVVRSYSDDWLIELQKDATIARIIGYKFGLNSSSASECAEDKVLTYTLLRDHDVAAVPHLLVRTKATINQDWQSNDWTAIITKPLTGTSGHGVKKFTSASASSAWMNSSGIEAWAVSPFLDIVRETRLIILDNKVLLAYEKVPVTIDGLKMFNLGLGATAKVITIDENTEKLGRAAARVLQLRLSAVDIVELASGEEMVLEVNDGIMLEHFVRTSSEYKALGYGVYERIIDAMMT